MVKYHVVRKGDERGASTWCDLSRWREHDDWKHHRKLRLFSSCVRSFFDETFTSFIVKPSSSSLRSHVERRIFFFNHHRRASMCVNKADDGRPCDYKVTRKLDSNSYVKARCWYEGWTFWLFEFVFHMKYFFCISKDVDLDGNFQNILIRLWELLSFWER